MEYILKDDKIVICSKEHFNIQHILECGQVFSYKKVGEKYLVYSGRHVATVVETEAGYEIMTSEPKYFERYFDLKTDYEGVTRALGEFEIMKKPIEYGSGIRILKQNIPEVVISFIISANNNIKRIQKILEQLKESLGEDMGGYHAFPTFEALRSKDVDFFTQCGAGYRAKYLYNVVREVTEEELESYCTFDTNTLRQKLIALSGVGPKVADCIMLYGYHRMDVFPVDTWIHKMYTQYFGNLTDRVKIRNNLIATFGELSGYAQQYLFFYMREKK